MSEEREDIRRNEAAAALGAPPGLEGYRARRGDADLLMLEWPLERGEPARALGHSEREVLALTLAGLSSARIASRRRRSRRTVENQLASIFAKVGVRGRLELFARYARPRSGGGP
jgi:DNA-binding CsgD family transcriptional regulator